MIRDFKPNKNPPISGLDRIRAYDQNQKIWEYLKRYQSSQFVEKKLKKEITRNRSTIRIKSNQISSLMVQSEKYYEAARSAPLEIKPLILYYGMVGLSKCLILSGDNQYTLSALAPDNRAHSTHGLTFGTPNPTDRAIRDGRKISNEFCYVTTNANRVGLYNLLRQCYSNTIIPNNTRFVIQDLLSLIPELYKEYLAYFKQKPRSWGANAHFGINNINDTIHLIVFEDWYYHTQRINGRERYPNSILRSFPELNSLYTGEVNSDDKFRLNNNAVSIDDYIYVSQLMTLESFALKRLNGNSMSDIDVHFILLYIFSNLVRYRQDKWSRLIRRLDNDEMFLIESFIEISSVKFPYLILRELDNVDYVFTGQIATWG